MCGGVAKKMCGGGVAKEGGGHTDRPEPISVNLPDPVVNPVNLLPQVSTEKYDGSVNLMGTYWTPKAIMSPSLPSGPGSPEATQPTPDNMKGAWDHSSLPSGVVVDGDEVLVGKSRFKFVMSALGHVVEVCDYTLQRFEGDCISWIAKDDSGHVCTWTRKQVLPKRKRNPSDKLAEAEEHTEEVTKWLSHQRRGLHKSNKKPTKTKELPNLKPSAEVVTPTAKPKPKEEIKISAAELKRLNKALQRREKPVPQDKDERGRGFTTKVKNADSDDEHEEEPGWLHHAAHKPAEWAGWERLSPHNLSYQAMEHLTKEDFPVGKVEKKHASPSKFAVEILARAPVLTSETSKQCRANSDCTEFLSEQEAWPNVTRKLMHTHLASNKCATYLKRTQKGEIEAAAVLKVKEKNEQRLCWIEFIRADNSLTVQPKVTRSSPNGHKKGNKKPDAVKQQPRPVPAFMAALESKLGPSFDKLVLQVHSNNKHALERFGSKYGFIRDKQYDQAWKGRGIDYQLLGMSKSPVGKALEVANARQQVEVSKKRERNDDEHKDCRRSRPRRAATKEIDYKDPVDPGITADDLVMAR